MHTYMHIREYLEKGNKTIIFISGIIITLLMGLFDYVTGVEISFGLFYMLPIFFVTWYVDKRGGTIIALLSAMLWFLADVSAIQRYSSAAIPFWNAIVRFGFFAIAVYLLSEVKNLSIKLEEKVKMRTADLTTEIAERKKTEEELRKKSEKLRQLAKRVQEIKEAENSKIAREIHDELGQALTAIKIETMSISKKYTNDSELDERISMIVDTVDDTIKSIRSIARRLRPRLLDELGLMPAIQWQLREFQSRTGIRYTLVSSDENIKLHPSVSTALFRILQEAITNVARHSKATSLSVVISDSNGNVTMNIRDNGIGFRNGALDNGHSLGILGMQERARMLHGNLDFVPVSDGGTEIIVNIPVR
jgi:signal transduction histidine kinase